MGLSEPHPFSSTATEGHSSPFAQFTRTNLPRSRDLEPSRAAIQHVQPELSQLSHESLVRSKPLGPRQVDYMVFKACSGIDYAVAVPRILSCTFARPPCWSSPHPCLANELGLATRTVSAINEHCSNAPSAGRGPESMHTPQQRGSPVSLQILVLSSSAPCMPTLRNISTSSYAAVAAHKLVGWTRSHNQDSIHVWVISSRTASIVARSDRICTPIEC
ncbi:hypothetical protein BKA62DRAFT_83028 [Auriculariales sp. MPI-PUGE-AT-0066]|nr:hypothetical protein BKA62DRAFT_83028 [Auriculariales sp. MPI-PUGE-AT-0066]